MKYKTLIKPAIAASMVLAAGACDSIFEVENPNVIEASTVDPLVDGETFSRSAFQNFADAYANVIVYSAWFTTEAWVGDTFPTRNVFGRRIVDDATGDLADLWFDLNLAIASADEVRATLATGPSPQSDINIARAALSSGFAIQIMAETFCEGTIRVSNTEGGPRLTTAQLLDAAVARFTQAIEVGTAAEGEEADSIANAARVGRARAHLQAGRLAEAAADAAQVPDDFVFEVAYVDDQGSRGRLGNGVYFYSAGGSRESLVVPPVYRDMADAGDPRITYIDADRFAQDGVTLLFSQTKYPTWSSPIRLASGLEANYIEVEANGDQAAMVAFINERRAVGEQGPYTGPMTDEAVLAELMAQRSRDFWLELKRHGDIRRHPGLVPNFIEPGDNYYKPQVGTVSDQICWPIPDDEVDANSNL